MDSRPQKKLDQVKNAKLTENFPEGLIYRSVKVYQLDVNIDGSVSQEMKFFQATL